MRFPIFRKVSLAAKVRLLFGGAVLLIVGVALLAPFDRMQRQVEEQGLIEARQRATIALLDRCGPARGGAAPRTGGGEEPDPQAGQPGRVGKVWMLLRPDDGEGRPDWPAVIVPPPEPEKAHGFVRTALEHFAEHPDDPEAYRFRTRKISGPDGEGEREQLTLEYVRALRIKGHCGNCHLSETSPRQFKADQLAGLIHVRMPIEQPTLAGVPQNLALLIAAGTLAVALAVLVFYVIMKSLVLSPVRKLRRLADHIGEGDLAVRSTIRTGDEFERLARAFNSMLERLQTGQQQMKQINQSLNSKMDELARANVALFESNRLKSEFLARVSHELRTPLNSIIGFAEVLRDQMAEEQARQNGAGQAGKAARYADNILTSGRMLLELINDLLDLSKIEAGKMVVRFEKVVVRDLVEAVINFMRPAAEKKSLQVKVSVDPEIPLVETDGGKFQQILYNLFSNAVKFTPPRGAVAVRAVRNDGELAVSVSDTGPGIPPEDQEGIFEKFHQLDQPATREHGGTGLGLSISRELADMLGGRLTVVSKMGEGSTFTLTLPLRPGGDESADGAANDRSDRSDRPADRPQMAPAK